VVAHTDQALNPACGEPSELEVGLSDNCDGTYEGRAHSAHSGKQKWLTQVAAQRDPQNMQFPISPHSPPPPPPPPRAARRGGGGGGGWGGGGGGGGGGAPG
jgi:hypothetical protein